VLDLAINSSITHTLLFLVPVGCALLLRWARCPGWAVVGGAVAGILLGPTILGRAAPAALEKLFVGGVEEREARDAVLRRYEIERLAMVETARAEPAFADLDARRIADLAGADAAWKAATWTAQRPLRSFSTAFVALALLGAGLLRVERGERRVDPITASSIGLWSALLPGALAATALVWIWRCPPAQAVLAGAAVAIGPWALTRDDRAAADEAEVGGARLIQTAGRLASLVAVGGVAAALASELGPRGLVWAAPMLALPAGWMLPAAKRAGLVRALLEILVVPSIAACVALRVELHAHLTFWPVVVFALLSGDGRWLGAFVGAILHGRRRGLRTMRLVLPAMAAGPTQLAIAAIAAHTRTVPEFVMPALLAGAVLVEITAPARRALSDRLARTEEELSELKDDR
jgi:hypothetical protein